MEDRESTYIEFVTARYSALAQLWAHQNTTRLQWPAVVIGAAFLVISTIFPSDQAGWDIILDRDRWGKDPIPVLKLGIPLVFSGVGTLVMLYIMERATTNMYAILREIHKLEEHMGVCIQFKTLTHPRGLSGGRLISVYMALFMAIPMTLSGCVFSMGLLKGLIVALVIAAFYTAILYRLIKHR